MYAFLFFFHQKRLKFSDDAGGHGHMCLNVSVIMGKLNVPYVTMASVFRTRTFVIFASNEICHTLVHMTVY